MTKRKRQTTTNALESNGAKKTKTGDSNDESRDDFLTVQVVAGSYDRVLHGLTATLKAQGGVEFADTFLFNAHASAIRCLALSPPSAPVHGQAQQVMLATGSSDERIYVFNQWAHPPRRRAGQDLISSIAPRPVAESSRNRELGTLLHHSSTVTRLSFPTRSKLLSSSEDSTIAVTRTRDWSLLSTIKAPIPKAHGRPSGDTAGAGGLPSGVNDFAVHPSLKVMISVSKGERCMRLWNLVTGKKAGVLNFGRGMLEDAGESKLSAGEGRRVIWGSCGGQDEIAVAFDRDAIVFGMDSRPKCKLLSDSKTKIHELCYVKLDDTSDAAVLGVSTEDGRILFFSTRPEASGRPEQTQAGLPAAKLVSQLGGRAAGVPGRIKDFAVLPLPSQDGTQASWLVVSGGSGGSIRNWKLALEDLRLAENEMPGKQVGRLLGTYETQNRITCVKAYVMIDRPEGLEESDDDEDDDEDEDEDEDDDKSGPGQ